MIKVTDLQYSMDENLYSNLVDFTDDTLHKWDLFLINDGIEGSGKTTLSEAEAYVINDRLRRKHKINTELTLDNVLFTPQQIHDFIDNCPDYSQAIIDEAIIALFSGDGAKAIVKALVKKLVLIRKKKLSIILNIPWFYVLNMYLAVGRSKALIHVYTPDGRRRGWFEFYNYNQKHTMYFKNKKYFSYRGVKNDFRGTFPNTHGLFFDIKEYDRKKDDAIKSFDTEVQKKDKAKSMVAYFYHYRCYSCGAPMKQKNIAEAYGCKQSNISQMLKTDIN